MPFCRYFPVFTLVFLVVCGLSHPAEAVRVKNRDTVAHQLRIATTPGDERVIELEPGEIFRTYAPAVTLTLLTGPYPGTQKARYLDEYVIWPDGKLHIQKRRWPAHRAFGL